MSVLHEASGSSGSRVLAFAIVGFRVQGSEVQVHRLELRVGLTGVYQQRTSVTGLTDSSRLYLGFLKWWLGGAGT